MFHLEGPWLMGALALAYLVGAFTIRYIKDVLKGVPGAMRTALNANETNALARLKAAEQAAINEAVGLLPAVAPVAPATGAAAAAPATAAAPAASEVQKIADQAVADIKAALTKVSAAPATSSAVTDMKTVGDEAAAKIKSAAGTAAADVKTAVAEVAAKV